MSKQWLAVKDKAMTKESTSGTAVILEKGSTATRKNIDRLLKVNKPVNIFQLNEDGNDHWKTPEEYITENRKKRKF